MDPLSIAASTSALLTITNSVIDWGVSAYKAKEERLELYDRIQGVEPVLNLVLKRQKDAAKYPDERWWDGLEALSPNSHPPGPLSRLDSLVRVAATELKPSSGVRKLMHSALHFWTKETYQAKIADISHYCAQIGLIVQNAHVDISLSNSRQGKQTHAKVEEVHITVESLADDVEFLKIDAHRRQEELRQVERRDIAYWLSPLTYLKRQDDYKAQTHSTVTGQWFLEREEYRQWMTGRPWQLRCYGEPGAGKTIVASVVVDHLQGKLDPGSSQVLCMYLENKDMQNLTMPNLLGSLIQQLVLLDTSRPVPDRVRELYKSFRLRDSRPDEMTLLGIVMDLIKRYRRCYLVVDGLDECPEQVRWDLEGRLRDLHQTGKLSIMTTGRLLEAKEGWTFDCDRCTRKKIQLYWHCVGCGDDGIDVCQDCYEKGERCEVESSHKLAEIYERVEFTIKTPDTSIERYVRDELKNEIRDAKAGQNDWRITQRVDATRLGEHIIAKPSLAEDIPQAIVAKADGMFIYAKLYMSSLRLQHTVDDVIRTLDNFPTKLPQIYQQTMQERILDEEDDGDRDKALRILSLVLCARQPLSLTALQHALAVKPGVTELKVGKKMSKNLILKLTKGLLTIDSSEDPLVRLYHLTFQEYLNENKDLYFTDPELDMAVTCLAYLSLTPLAKAVVDDAALESRFKQFPLLAYAAQHWGEHVREAKSQDTINRAARRYLREPSRLEAWSQAVWYAQGQITGGWDVRKKVSQLHVCTWFGLDGVIATLDPDELDIDAQERTYGQTALMYACRQGHERVVQQLLDLHASPNLQSARGRTALFEAVERDRGDIVDTLLANPDLDVNMVWLQYYDRTALIVAAKRGYNGIVESLLDDSRTDVNAQDLSHWTALAHAVKEHAIVTDKIAQYETRTNIQVVREREQALEEREHIFAKVLQRSYHSIINLLLRHPRTDIDRPDLAGRSPLILAAQGNDTTITGLLLLRGANKELRDKQHGSTALQTACNRGHEDMIQWLLDHGADIDCRDDSDRGLVHSASYYGHSDIIRIVADKGLSVERPDSNGFTPLHDASRYKQESTEVVDTLISLGANLAAKDRFGRTPLIVARQYSRSAIVDVLTREAIKRNLDAQVPDDKQLPAWALVKTGNSKLLEHVLRNVESGDGDGHGGASQVYLTQVEPGTDDTALHWAVITDQTNILRLLLQHSDSLRDCANRNGKTPLHLAAIYDRQEAAKVLISSEADVSAKDRFDATPLSIAQIEWHYEIAVMLVEAGADFKMKGIDSQALLFAAVEQDNAGAVCRLVEGGVDKLARNEHGKTALELAKAVGH
ncbi:hypothetical protein LTR28_003901, partial [Elasticomyces elasticus]